MLVVYAGDDVLLELSGDLRHVDTAALCECVASAISEGPRRLVLHFDGLASIDGDGIECLRFARRLATQSHVDLILEAADSDILAKLNAGSEAFSTR